jgi:hypothetical protein
MSKLTDTGVGIELNRCPSCGAIIVGKDCSWCVTRALLTRIAEAAEMIAGKLTEEQPHMHEWQTIDTGGTRLCRQCGEQRRHLHEWYDGQCRLCQELR